MNSSEQLNQPVVNEANFPLLSAIYIRIFLIIGLLTLIQIILLTSTIIPLAFRTNCLRTGILISSTLESSQTSIHKYKAFFFYYQ